MNRLAPSFALAKRKFCLRSRTPRTEGEKKPLNGLTYSVNWIAGNCYPVSAAIQPDKYAGHPLSLIPTCSHCARKPTASRPAMVTSFKSNTTDPGSASVSDRNCARSWPSIRPLSAKVIESPSTSLRILSIARRIARLMPTCLNVRLLHKARNSRT